MKETARKNFLFNAAKLIAMIVLISAAFTSVFCNPGRTTKLTITNPLNSERKDEVISLPLYKLKGLNPEFNENAFVVFDHNSQLPSQTEDIDGDGKAENIIILLDIKAKETKTIVIESDKADILKNDYKKRTHAEISIKVGYKPVNGVYSGGEFQSVKEVEVPKDHFAHDALYKFEGPGWESDRVAYRFYLDSRNRNDIFGKTTDKMILREVGQNDLVSDSRESYTKMCSWGMDIFKVGESLGIGSIGMICNGKVNAVSKTEKLNCRITADGPVRSGVLTSYNAWQVDSSRYNLNSLLSINAGSRLTECVIGVTGNADNICTGIAKHENCSYIEDSNENKWGYIASYGKQSLAGDNLGLVIFFRKSDLKKISEDGASYIVELKPSDGKVSYYFGAAWEQELNGIKTKDEFLKDLDKTAIELSNPLIVDLEPAEKISEAGKDKVVALDYYYNHETKKDKDGKLFQFHYTWEDKENSGFSVLGDVIKNLGAAICSISSAPAKGSLQKSSIYIIVDPDIPQENPSPNYITDSSAQVIEDWVKDGGVLVLMGNDKGNAEFEHLNNLSERFGIRFNENCRNKVTGINFDMGKFDKFPKQPIFQNINSIYLKEISTFLLKAPAQPILTDGEDIIMACSAFGKGFVFAVGDPWLYNEYIDNRRLPVEFENYKASINLFKWLLGKATAKKDVLVN